MSELQGRRCADKVLGEKGDGDWPKLPGEYARVKWGDGWAVHFIDPLGREGRVASHHTITEEDDGTITVEPSIAPFPGQSEPTFHGWLKHGVWTWRHYALLDGATAPPL